ncbi:esterase B1-like [Culicoides brevitarsis]|uniref:esterase B1-like n=1 Tax=Culicoides brevitarsis TaxID=469753 RepID=UPI00307C0352
MKILWFGQSFETTTLDYETTQTIFDELTTFEVTDLPDLVENVTEKLTTTTPAANFHPMKPTIFKPTKNTVVKIQEGSLKGVYKKGFYHFMGIRYGQAPLGERRFKPALPENSWEGVRLATKFGSACPHTQAITRTYLGIEDCLFLNVFTKAIPTDENFKEPRAVMVWLHGGAFRAGSGNFPLTGPDFLVNEDVVVVTLNYRLGALGFLCVNDEARGNMGIHDQILALKWIQRNIAVFGGDPEKVTIFGFSAGGVSVDILMLSDAAKGLFRHAISQSGSILSPWSFVENPKMQAMRLGRDLGFKGNSTDELVRFLKEQPVRSLVEKSEKMDTPEEERNALIVNFTPCVEKVYENDSEPYEAIIKESPLKILRSGNYKNIPYMTGFTANEGILIFKNYLFNPGTNKKFKSSDMYFIPSNINITGLHKAEIDVLAQDISHIYIGLNKNISSSKIADAMVRYGTDVHFLYGMTRTVRELLRHGNKNIHSYRFAFDGAFNFYKKFVGYLGPGVAHGDELGYLFAAPSYMYVGVNMLDIARREMVTKNRMVKMWTNFAKYGNPTPRDFWPFYTIWEPMKDKKFSYLDISDDLEMIEGVPNVDRVEFWDEVYHEYEKRSTKEKNK